MYPLIYIFSYPTYTFGIFLSLSFIVFLLMLNKFSKKVNFSLSIFSNNVLWYFASIFFFSRLFYVISKFNLKYMDSLSDFFATTDYNFSLFGAIFGFLIVFLINLRLRGEKAIKYIDSLVMSFLLALVFGYIGALLGGQVYGSSTNFGIEITYNNPFAILSSANAVFPLAIIYSILFFIEFAFLYILSMYIKIKGFIAYIGLLIFSLIILIFENFSGKTDIFNNLILLNMNQFLAIILMIFSFYRLYILSKIGAKDTTIILDHK